MDRKIMLDQVIRKFGFEHRWTVQFARMCEDANRYTDEMVLFRYDMLMDKYQ